MKSIDRKPNTSNSPSSSPKENIHSDESIPPEILEAARLDSECARLRNEIGKNTELHEQSSTAFTSALLAGDLNNRNERERIADLRDQVQLSTDKITRLQEILDSAEVNLKAASNRAAQIVDSLCVEAAYGHIEVAAQGSVSHFASIKDARRTFREVPAALEWFHKRIFQDKDFGPSMTRVMSRAREAVAEIKKLREKLGGPIPSAVEMTAL